MPFGWMDRMGTAAPAKLIAQFLKPPSFAQVVGFGTAGPNLPTKMAVIAKGSNRGQAAVVTGTWGLARLRGDAQAHGAIVVQSLAGTLQHGTDAEKKAAVAYTRLAGNLAKVIAVHGQRARLRAGG
jgi:hypothetical protein